MDSQALPITEPSQVGEARRTAITRAIQLGFSESERGKVALVVTEAANNLIRHAERGTMLLRSLARDGVLGLEVMTLDTGPGMRYVGQCLQDGYSTAGTAGNGLGAIARLSSSFDLYSVPGSGTALVARLWSQPVAQKVDGYSLRVDGPARARPSGPSTLNPQPSTNVPLTPAAHRSGRSSSALPPTTRPPAGRRRPLPR